MTRRHRSIVLDCPVAPKDGFHVVTEKKGSEQHTVTERWRVEDQLHIKITRTRIEACEFGTRTAEEITVISRPCFISFDTIMDCVEVVEDDDGRSAPWDDDDGWVHETISYDDFVYGERLQGIDADKAREHFKSARGYVWSTDHTPGRIMVTLDDCKFAEENRQGYFDWMRHSGASKQVAAEMTALWERRYIDQLVKWYNEGWNWYGVRGEFYIDGNHLEAGNYGIDDEDWANDVVRPEIADQIASDLEKLGYVIVETPGGHSRPVNYVAPKMRLERMRENAKMQNWTS